VGLEKMQDHNTLSVKTIEQFEELRDIEHTYEKVPYLHHFLCPDCNEETSSYAMHKRPNGDYIRYRKCHECGLKFKTTGSKKEEKIFENDHSSDPRIYKSFASFHYWAISDPHINPIIRKEVLASLRRVKKKLEISESFAFEEIK